MDRIDYLDLESSTPFRFDVALVGLGYVGLPTMLAFHAAGCRTLGLDASPQRLDAIRAERPDLLDSDRERLRFAVKDARFELTGNASRLREAGVVIIAVPTPVDEHLSPDLSILRGACATVVANAVRGQVLILTSTTYVGSTKDLLVAPLIERGFVIGRDISIAFSPERIDPGNNRHAHEDVPRVVGGVTEGCANSAMSALGSYAAKLHRVSSPEAAEMTKLVENTFRAVNIAFVNELAEVSRTLGLDVAEIVDAAATKPYGFMPFFPGPGVGGHCIPCDPHYLLWQLRPKRLNTPVIEQAMAAIARRPKRVIERVGEVLSQVGRGIQNASVMLLGVTYKPDVADARQSPALEILAGLIELGARTSFHDPLMTSLLMPDGTVLSNVQDPASNDADLVVVHTLHSCIDLSWLHDVPLILDTSYRLQALPQRVAL